MRISIASYGVGNMHSITKAVERTGVAAVIAKTPAELFPADGIILPGVGSFSAGSRWFAGQREEAARLMRETPVLGICLGCQLLLEDSEEGSGRGLGLIPGNVKRLHANKVPNMGWEKVSHPADSILFEGIPDGEPFYFVHSYIPVPSDIGDKAATTTMKDGDGSVTFTSAIARGNIFGVQFHPEKSSTQGLRLISNFVDHSRRICRCR